MKNYLVIFQLLKNWHKFCFVVRAVDKQCLKKSSCGGRRYEQEEFRKRFDANVVQGGLFAPRWPAYTYRARWLDPAHHPRGFVSVSRGIAAGKSI